MCSNQSPLPSPNMAATAATPVMPAYSAPAAKPFVEGNPSQNSHPFASIAAHPSGLLPIDQYRLQLYNYAMVERLRFSGFGHYNNQVPFCPGYPYNPRLALQMSLFHNRAFQPEEPKPQHSYIGLIAMAILSSPEGKLVLSDIYQYILDNYPYFRTRGPGWRNSIRHNLSLNDCFIKAGRSANGKGHYWAIHPANVDDFKKGDFRRRKAQRKVRKHMGLAVDEEGDDSPSPPPVPVSPPPPPPPPRIPLSGLCPWPPVGPAALGLANSALFPPIPSLARKRQFDVASLLAPDDAPEDACKLPRKFEEGGYLSSGDEMEGEDDIDVVSEDLSMPNPKRARESDSASEEAPKKERSSSASPSERSYPKNSSPAESRPRSASPSPTEASRLPPDANEPSSPAASPHDSLSRGSQLPFWIRQPGIIHPTAIFPPATLSFVEHHQQIVNRFYEQRIAAAAQHQQQRRLFQQQQQQQQQHQQSEPPDDLSPVNLKNEAT